MTTTIKAPQTALAKAVLVQAPQSLATRPVQIPRALEDVALITAETCAAAAAMSLSQWYQLVRDGEAPAPAVRGVRFTRWQLSAVRAWLIERAAVAV